MNPHETDRRHIERQIAYARPIVVLLALIALLQQPSSGQAASAFSFLIALFVRAVSAVLFEKLVPARAWDVPLICDLVALGYFMVVSPSMVPAWFPYLFVCYVAGIRWGLGSAFPLAGVLSLEIMLLTWSGARSTGCASFGGSGSWAPLSLREPASPSSAIATRLFAVQNEFFARITATMEVDQGLSECLRLFLDELTHAFQSAEALLIYRDSDLERIFLWRLKSGESERTDSRKPAHDPC